MKQAILLTVMMTAHVLASAQQGVIVRQNGLITEFRYTSTFSGLDLQAAIDACSDGDTLILPGGTFTVTSNNIFVGRPIVFIGAGWQATSSPVMPTVITSPNASESFIFGDESEGSAIHGVSFYVNGTSCMEVVVPKEGTQNLHFHRCQFWNVELGSSVPGPVNSQIYFEECLFSLLSGFDATSVSVDNCIFKSGPVNGMGANFSMSNSVMHSWSSSVITGANYTNNVFMRNSTNNTTITELSTFNNCLFIFLSGGTLNPGAATVINCQTTTQSLTNLFQDVNSLTGYDAAHDDYHAVSTSLVDAMNVGIYEGLHLWKEPAVPFNPHWTGLTVPGITNGGLIQNVVIQGQAQTH